MPKFVLAYHGSPQFESKEDGMDHMTAWKAWMHGLGDAVIDPGHAVGPSHTIHADQSVTPDGGSNPLVGVTILEADSIEAAIEMAKPCPHISAGGTLEIAQTLDMDM